MYEMIREGSRAEYYRWRNETETVDGKDLELRDRIQSIALEWSVYGYRRIWAELKEARDYCKS